MSFTSCTQLTSSSPTYRFSAPVALAQFRYVVDPLGESLAWLHAVRRSPRVLYGLLEQIIGTAQRISAPY